ncbi:MAG TPA: VOC family protein [Limnobacter sp.]|nr:VOC family protein [Limnobacter sp.]
MLGYVTFGTNDLKKSAEFFDKLLAPLGAKRLLEVPRGVFWGTGFDKAFFGVMTPINGEPAQCGNGAMAALAVSSREKADEMYKLALSLGCTCEGAPGERMPGFYAAYFRTPEGHKMNVFKLG